MDNIRKLCGLELKDILIQQEFNFTRKESNYVLYQKRKGHVFQGI
jgi:hypothetical protein